MDDPRVDGLSCPIMYIVHPADPRHLVGGFALLRHALTLCHLFYPSIKCFFCLFIDVGEIIAEFTAEL